LVKLNSLQVLLARIVLHYSKLVCLIALIMALTIGSLGSFVWFDYHKEQKFELQLLKMELKIQEIEKIKITKNEVTAMEKKVLSIAVQYNPSVTTRTIKAIVNNTIANELDLDLVLGMITWESARTWNPKIKSPAGAIGLMQIMPATAKWLASRKDVNINYTHKNILKDPTINIYLGCKYLRYLLDAYGFTDPRPALAAYNGPIWKANLYHNRLVKNNPDAHLVLATETQGYIPGVLKLREEYARFGI